MTLTLGSITLHPKMAWTDEFVAGDAVYSDVITLSGKLVRQHGIRSGGRPITLVGGYATRSLLVDLQALQNLAVPTTLTLQDGRTFLTEFKDANSVIATPVGEYSTPTDDDYYALQLNLIEVVT